MTSLYQYLTFFPEVVDNTLSMVFFSLSCKALFCNRAPNKEVQTFRTAHKIQANDSLVISVLRIVSILNTTLKYICLNIIQLNLREL